MESFKEKGTDSSFLKTARRKSKVFSIFGKVRKGKVQFFNF
jgi:hypothetical protein